MVDLNLVLEVVSVAGFVATAFIAFVMARGNAPKMAWLFLTGFIILAFGFAVDSGFIVLPDPATASNVSDAAKLVAMFLFFFAVFEFRGASGKAAKAKAVRRRR